MGNGLFVSCQLSVVSCPLSVGAKHLEDKLSVIAKNSSPNASPVQLSVVSCQLSVVISLLLTNDH
ncbi:MAG: hypothetical protein HEQ33_03920 [Dolichospermum sp. WA123]|nr:hypothetical protein [Dolichospermum sp. WA123]